MTSGPELEPGLLLAGRYRLRAVLGRGGAGTVWHADDAVLDRPVAVKLLHPDLERDHSAVARFRREATAAAAMTHPNAVIVYDIGEADGRVFLVMELVDGVTLSDLLADGRLAPDDTVTVGLAMARALGAAHTRGLIHRDVKPGNVLVTRDGVAKVADFGIATALGDAQARLTTPGMVVGTSAYLAPEQLEDSPLDARADVYSLGLVLHECLTGRQTFSGGTAVEVATRRLAGDVPAPSQAVPGVPEELDLAVARATRRDPGRRFEDGGALAAAIAGLLPPDAGPRLAHLVAGHLGPVDRDAAAVRGPITDPAPATVMPAVAAARAPAPPTGGDEAATTAVPRVSSEPAAAGREPGTATLPATGGTAAPASERSIEEPPPRRSGWRGPLPWALVLLGLALFGIALLDVVRGDDENENPADEATGDEVPAELAIVGGESYDPLGTSPEHPEDVPKAFDGDPGTAWQTQRYNTAAFGGLKEGVGLWLDLGESTTVSELAVALRPAGADLTVFAADEPPPPGVDAGWSPADWGRPVAESASSDTETTLSLDDATGRYFLLWFTSLPADGGGHRVHVGEVTVAP